MSLAELGDQITAAIVPPATSPKEPNPRWLWFGHRTRGFAAALWEALRNCTCDAPLPHVPRPMAPVARVFLLDKTAPALPKVYAGMLPLGPVLREPEQKGSGVLDRLGLEFESSEAPAPADPLAAACAALFDDDASEDEKREAFRVLDAQHPLGRPFRKALNDRQSVVCLRCGGNLQPTTPWRHPELKKPAPVAEAAELSRDPQVPFSHEAG